jgi:transglutaminase-like putative cysteine protease
MHDPYLSATAIIDHEAPAVRALAAQLRRATHHDTAQACFEWVRDHIEHCIDAQRGPVRLSASDVLQVGIGYCYSQAHLLAALLRANGLRAGLCYQRLTLDGPGTGYCLHGLNAVWLNDTWYRIDPRGNRPGVDAQFTPPIEHLAFPIEHPGEYTLPEIYAAPLPAVVQALAPHPHWQHLLAHLPDKQPSAALSRHRPSLEA